MLHLVPLVKGRTVVVEVAEPLIMSGGADLLDFSHDIGDALVGNVCLRFLIGKQFGRFLDALSPVVHLAGALVDPLDSLAC